MRSEQVLLIEWPALASKQPEVHKTVEHPAKYFDGLRTSDAEAHMSRNVAMVVQVGVVGEIGNCWWHEVVAGEHHWDLGDVAGDEMPGVVLHSR